VLGVRNNAWVNEKNRYLFFCTFVGHIFVRRNEKMLKILKSEFTKNVAALITGTTIAQAIPLLIAPVLTRIYTPEDFGLLATLTSMTMIVGSVATGRYEMALIIPKKESYADNLFIIGLIFSL
jgi:hypothetical protein